MNEFNQPVAIVTLIWCNDGRTLCTAVTAACDHSFAASAMSDVDTLSTHWTANASAPSTRPSMRGSNWTPPRTAVGDKSNLQQTLQRWASGSRLPRLTSRRTRLDVWWRATLLARCRWPSRAPRWRRWQKSPLQKWTNKVRLEQVSEKKNEKMKKWKKRRKIWSAEAK